MRIEHITPPAPPKTYWMLTFEDGSTLRAYEAAMIDYALHVGMELSDEQREVLTHMASGAKLRERAVHILSLRPHSRGELQKKLLAKGATEEDSQDVLDWAERIGLLSDAEVAKGIVRSYSARGYGPYKIREELYRHAIPKSLWDEALETLPEPDTAIDAYLERHLKSHDRKAIKRAADALARRGYSWSGISDGLRRHRLTDELDDYDEV